MKRLSFWALAGFGVLASGCEMTLPPQSAPVTQPNTQASLGCTSPIAVQSGDTVYSVARRCGVSVRDLIETNGLQPPYALAPGSSLRMPGSAAEIVVGKGDTLLVLARRNHVDFNSFAAANHKTPPYTIRLGEHLRLPGSFVAAVPSTLPTGSTKSQSTVEYQPLPPSHIPPKPIPSDALPPQAFAPPVAPPKPVQSATPSTTPAAPPPPSAAAPVPLTPQSSAMTAPVPVPQSAAAPSPVVTAKGFMWPVKGDVLLTFGPQTAKGQNNDGINIAAPKGTHIHAVESGTVAYVGNELKGFGNLVLIKHADGWVSAYAHADQILVKKGQTITKGQEIGTVGQTGSVTQSQLHFELRRQGEAVDPEEYLPG